MVDRLVNSKANEQRIRRVEDCFGGAGQPLAIPNRVLVGEGVLTKMCRKRPKPRQFFLFNDIIVYGNIVINKKKYNKQHVIPLEQVRLELIDDTPQLRHGFYIISGKKSFAVYAATATEKSEWMAHVQKCVADLIAKGGINPAETSELAPAWVPDAETTHCMHCKRTVFSFVNRRHHCRRCGMVACSACTTKRFLLPNQSSKPLRVCDTCFAQLTAVGPDADQPASPSTSALSSASADESSGEDDSDDEGLTTQAIDSNQHATTSPINGGLNGNQEEEDFEPTSFYEAN